MSESWRKVYQSLTGPLKAVLDRRYVRLDHLESYLATIIESERSITKTLDSLAERLEGLEETMVSVQDELAQAKPGSDFVAAENPHELRKKLFAAHRLANECAISIERLLQADLLIRRDLDAISETDIESIG